MVLDEVSRMLLFNLIYVSIIFENEPYSIDKSLISFFDYSFNLSLKACSFQYKIFVAFIISIQLLYIT